MNVLKYSSVPGLEFHSIKSGQVGVCVCFLEKLVRHCRLHEHALLLRLHPLSRSYLRGNSGIMVKIDVMPFVPYLNHSRIKFVPLQTFPILKQVKAVRLRSGVSSNSLFQANCSPEVDLYKKKNVPLICASY